MSKTTQPIKLTTKNKKNMITILETIGFSIFSFRDQI